MENLDREMCPICGKKFKFQCKCLIGERTCENGHTWFLCPIHRSVVVGKSDHGKGIGECHCTRDRCKRCGSDEINMDIETYRVKCRKCGYTEGGDIRDTSYGVVPMDYDTYSGLLVDAVLSNRKNCDKRTEFVKILKRFASELAGVYGPKKAAHEKSDDVLSGLQTRLKGLIPKEKWDEWDDVVNGIAEHCTLITVLGMLNDKFGAEKVKFTLNWLEKVV